MSADLLPRPDPSPSACRFLDDWCSRGCDEGIGGERNHWSAAAPFWAYDVDDERLAVQLYGYENADDGVDPVLVYIAAGDNYLDEDGCSIPTEQARSMGIHLKEFSPRSKWPEDDLVYIALDKDGHWAFVAEYRHERFRRDDSVQDAHIEFTIRPDSTRHHSIRVRLDLPTARAFGCCLIAEADRAASSNLKYGLEPGGPRPVVAS